MTSDGTVQVCCRACGGRIEATLSDLVGKAAIACPSPGCEGETPLPSDLADSARFLFAESRRRLSGAGPA